MRQAVAAVALHYAEGGAGSEPEFVTPNIGEFTLDVVGSAWHFPRGGST
ncbi:hypothetical protein ACIOHS_01995 [Streptomyces sp. NPDC088253]